MFTVVVSQLDSLSTIHYTLRVCVAMLCVNSCVCMCDVVWCVCVSMCACVSMYVYVHVHVCICICFSADLPAFLSVLLVHVQCTCIQSYLHMNSVHVHTCTLYLCEYSCDILCTCTCTYMCVYTCTCTCICMFRFMPHVNSHSLLCPTLTITKRRYVLVCSHSMYLIGDSLLKCTPANVTNYS